MRSSRTASSAGAARVRGYAVGGAWCLLGWRLVPSWVVVGPDPWGAHAPRPCSSACCEQLPPRSLPPTMRPATRPPGLPACSRQLVADREQGCDWGGRVCQGGWVRGAGCCLAVGRHSAGSGVSSAGVVIHPPYLNRCPDSPHFCPPTPPTIITPPTPWGAGRGVFERRHRAAAQGPEGVDSGAGDHHHVMRGSPQSYEVPAALPAS